jgi:hypothetical protein
MSIIIEGSSYFERQTSEALRIIKLNSPEKYNTVSKYINKIKQGENSRWHRDNLINRIFEFGEKVYSSYREYYAQSIVHDAYHSKLYHDYIEKHGSNYVPNNIYSGEKAEWACLEYGISFLEEINAPEHLINHVKSSRGTKWWESMTW